MLKLHGHDSGSDVTLPVKGGAAVKKMTFVAQLVISSMLVAGGTALSGPAIGVAEHDADNTAAGAADGDKRCSVLYDCIVLAKNAGGGDACSEALTFGSIVYMTDAETVANNSNGGARQPAGYFVGMHSDGRVKVFVSVAEDASVGLVAALASADPAKGSALIGYDGGTTVKAALDAGMTVKKKTVTITQAADLAGLGAGVKTFDKNVGTALPANARVLAATAEAVTDFDDAAHGTYVAIVGTSAGGNQVGTSLNVAAGQAGFPKPFTAGAQGYQFAPQGAAQLSARITSSVDLNTATVGAITINVFYVVLA